MRNAFCCRSADLGAPLTDASCSMHFFFRSSGRVDWGCVLVLVLPGCAGRLWSCVAGGCLDCSGVSGHVGFLFSLSGHLGEANSRRAVMGVPGLLPRHTVAAAPYAALPLQAAGTGSGPAAALAVDVASHSRGARRAEPAAPAARLPSCLSGRDSSIQDAYGSSCLDRGRGGRSGATRGEDAIRSGDSWSIAAARPRKAIAKPQPSASRQPRGRKDARGAPALAFPPLQPVSPSPLTLPLPPAVSRGKQVASRLGEGIPGLCLGDDRDDGGSVWSRQRLVGRTRPAEPRPQDRHSVVGSAAAAEPGGAGDPSLTAPAGPVPGAIIGRVPAAADPDADAAIERLLRRVNAKEQQLRARWSHLSAFLGAASNYRALLADCEQYVGLLTARADQLRANAGGARRVQAHGPAASGQREADKTVTVGKRH